MTEKDLTKTILSNYSASVIPICRLLKAHATNIMLLSENCILMQPIISGIRNYMIVNPKIDYSTFMNAFISIPEISKVNTGFRKTKSEISWLSENGTNYLTIKNDGMDLYKTPIINHPESVEDILTGTYQNIPNWSPISYGNHSQVLFDESPSVYTMLPLSFIDDMVDKKLCQLTIDDRVILISRPFLGDLKKTKSVGYRIIEKDENKMVLKFRQEEELGNIYTYAAFLNV